MNTAGHPPTNRTAPPPSKLWKADVIKKLETCVFSLAYILNARGEKTIVLLLGFIFLIHLLPHGRTGEIEQKKSSFLLFLQNLVDFDMLAKI